MMRNLREAWYGDIGKENGSYCSILGLYRGYGKEMETTIVYLGL